jgi:ribokinase
MQKPIVVVSSINLDLVVGADCIPQVGETIIGNSFNTFYGGKGGEPGSRSGQTGLPRFNGRKRWQRHFWNAVASWDGRRRRGYNYVNKVEGASGVALITTGGRGENNIVVVPGANSLLTPELLEKATPRLERAGFILAQLEIPLETVDSLAQFAERHDIPLMLDPAPACELSGALLRRVSWITPNETETQELLKTDIGNGDQGYDAAAERLLACGVKNVLLKLGSRGSVIAQRNLKKQHVLAFTVNAVDTTAAGDAFNGGFAVGVMRGLTVARCAVFASAVAAISVTRAGAQPSMPTEDEVERFLEQRSIATVQEPSYSKQA